MKRLVLFTLTAALFLNACKKEESKVVGYDIKNLSTKRVQATIYSSEEDYINQINPLWQGSVDAGKTTTIPESTLDEGYRYYIDWYSDDMTYSNWIAGDQWPNNELYFPASKTSAYFIRELGPSKRAAECNIRGTLLDNNNPATWKAVDAYSISRYQEPKRVWNTLTDWQKKIYITFSFNKAAFKSYKPTGEEHIYTMNTLDFEMERSNNNGVFTVSMERPNQYYVSNTTTISHPENSVTIDNYQKYQAAKDTIFLVTGDAGYLMVRE